MPNAKWPITRSHKEALEKLSLKTKDQRQGYVREPLIDFIEFDSVLIDTLHLLLRITDKLFDVLFKKFDTFDKSDSIDLNRRPCLKKFMNYLENDCSLTKPYYVSNGIKIKLRSLSGSERLKFLNICFDNQNEYLQKLFPEIDLSNENLVFKEFYNLFNIIKLNGASYDLKQLEVRLQNWLIAYLKLNESDNSITPYVHSFVFHMPEFLRMYDDINQFNMQGLEKLNDLATQYYHNSTNRNKKANTYITQIIAKRNRIEFFNLGGELDELEKRCQILREEEQISLPMNREEIFLDETETITPQLKSQHNWNIEKAAKKAALSTLVSSSSTRKTHATENKTNQDPDTYIENSQKKIKCSYTQLKCDISPVFTLQDPFNSSSQETSKKMDLADQYTIIENDDIKLKVSDHRENSFDLIAPIPKDNNPY